MQKIVVFAAIVLSVIHPQVLMAGLNSIQYPYALLGDDYGILNKNDFAINSCITTPLPFSEESTSYPYWQCFETAQSKILCEGDGYDESEQTRLTVMVISGVREGKLHEYITRRTIPLTVCRRFTKDWKRSIQGEKYICVAGSYGGQDKSAEGQGTSKWTFDRFKTKKSCEPYFFGGCSLSYYLKHGCKL